MWSNMEWFKSYFKLHFKNLDDWYFSQMKDGYYADYRPRYPFHSKTDYTVESTLNGLRVLQMTENGVVVLSECKNFREVFNVLESLNVKKNNYIDTSRRGVIDVKKEETRAFV